jgi:hypothetical protein
MILRQLVAAACAELIRDPHRTEAVAAAGGQLITALGAEMVFILHMGSASGTKAGYWQAQEEIENSANSAG